MYQINKFVSFLKHQRNDGFTEVWQSTPTYESQTVSAQVLTRGARNDQFDANDETKYKKMFNEIADNLIMQVSERLSSFEKLKYFDLLNGEHFNDYTQKTKFPENILKNLTESYPNTFEYCQLKSELTVFYASSEDIRRHIATLSAGAKASATVNPKDITPYVVFLKIEDKGIATSFEQIYKLSKLICTIPATSAAMEPHVSALKRIKQYLRSTQGQDRSSSLPLLSIEKAILVELQKEDHFYDRVIEYFLSVDGRVDFVYK